MLDKPPLTLGVAAGLSLFMACLSFGGGVLYQRYLGGGGLKVVTIDVIKVNNAQRKVLGDARAKGQRGRQLELLSVSRTLDKAVREIAGGKTVLVRQAIVGGVYPDITDEVLRRIGLPTDVSSDAPDAGPMMEMLLSVPDVQDAGKGRPTNDRIVP